MIKLVRNLIMMGFIFLAGYIFGIKEVRFFEIASSSMTPTLHEGDKVAAVKKTRLKRYDIVVLTAPKGPREKLTKRIIGLPGETVEVKDGKVFINGEKLKEDYLEEHPRYELEEEITGGSYFLLGDNRNESEDSSVWGPVSEKFITGRVVCRYWPFRDFKIFTGISIAVTER
ncbi:MAG: signal peptidase I [Candidatus Omnitrophica bacterium]|nr:signal peptidase I [Candidatus Omnitrophota bacterium]